VILGRVAAVVPTVSEDTVASIFKAFMNTYPVIQLHIPEDIAKAEIMQLNYPYKSIIFGANHLQ
jgi:hypothetical protein